MNRFTVRAATLLTAVLAAGGMLFLPPAPAGDTGTPRLASQRPGSIQQLSTLLGGTVAQRRAGEILAHHQVQDPVTACMHHSGFPAYTGPAFSDPYADITADELAMGTGAGLWLQPVGDVAQLRGEVGHLSGEPGPAAPGYVGHRQPGDGDAWFDALAACTPTVTGDVRYPDASHDLADELAQLIDTAEHDPVVAVQAAGYRRCMLGAGFPVTDRQHLGRYLQQLPELTEPLVEDAAAADGRCRPPVYAAMLAALETPLRVFLDSHDAALQLVYDQWRQITAAAQQFPEAGMYLH